MGGERETVMAIVDEVRRQNLPFLAGSLAFYAFVSLLPFLLLVLIATSLLAGDTVVGYVLTLTRVYLSPTGQNLLVNAITDAAGWAGSSLLGLVVLIWAAFRMFLGIDTAFTQLYGTEEMEPSIGQHVRDGVIALLAIVLALAGAVATVATATLLPEFSYSGVVDSLILVLGLLAVFFPLYYVFPSVDVTPREVLPGTLVATVGWALLEWLFQLYVSVTTLADVFGVIGGALLFLLWLYSGAFILLVGVVVNVVLAGR